MSNTIIYGAGVVVLTPTINGDGTAVIAPTPVRMRNCQNISGIDIKYDTKVAHGQGQFPLYAAKGKGTGSFTFEALDQTARQLNTAHGQTVLEGREALYEDRIGLTIPTTPFEDTVVPPNDGVFISDQGVYDGLTGIELVRVEDSPITGQYSVDTDGLYTFAAADVGKKVYRDYLYSLETGKQLILDSQAMGFTPFFSAVLSVNYQGDGILFNFSRVVIKDISTGTKLDDFAMMKYSCDVLSDPITRSIGRISLAS